MFIKKEELEVRLEESNNLVRRLKIEPPLNTEGARLDTTKFKNDGTHRDQPLYPPAMRAIIGATAIISGPAKAAEVFDCSSSYAGVLSRAQYSDDAEKNAQLKQDIYEELGKIRETAHSKLLLVLGLVNEENLEKLADKDKARLAAQIANQLSQVIDRTIKKDHSTDARSVHMHYYSPELRPVEAFNIKELPNDNAGENK